ncbi:hypothetical protein BH10ACI1_BH10ACI1_20350 [soil metagenome]
MRKTFILLCAVLLASFINASAQIRPIEKPQTETKITKPVPVSFTAKYEGGMFGFSEREVGTLKFDDENSRLVFFGDDQKEKFAIPYKSMLIVYPQSKSVNSTTTNVVKNLPLPGAGLAGFIKEKRRYLIINYDDPDVEAKGTVNFKIENKELLDSVIVALADKAKLTQRGDAFYRPRQTSDK